MPIGWWLDPGHPVKWKQSPPTVLSPSLSVASSVAQQLPRGLRGGSIRHRLSLEANSEANPSLRRYEVRNSHPLSKKLISSLPEVIIRVWNYVLELHMGICSINQQIFPESLLPARYCSKIFIAAIKSAKSKCSHRPYILVSDGITPPGQFRDRYTAKLKREDRLGGQVTQYVSTYWNPLQMSLLSHKSIMGCSCLMGAKF